MPPKSFEDHAKDCFDAIKKNLGTKPSEVIYKPKLGGTFPILGIFGDNAQEVDVNGERTISSNVYTLGIKLDDLPRLPVKGDRVTIKKVDYKVIDNLEDGVPGVSTVLILHKIGGAP